jgi:hypothetical protein
MLNNLALTHNAARHPFFDSVNRQPTNAGRLGELSLADHLRFADVFHAISDLHL